MKPAGKWIHRLLYPAVKWYFGRHPQDRSRVYLVNDQGKILLVKTWFGHQRWSFPGGGIEKGESPRAAAQRELLEETGIILSETDLEELTRLPSDDETFTAIIFRAKVAGEPLPYLPRGRNLEIIDRHWFSSDEITDEMSGIVRKVVKSLTLAN